MSALEHIDGLIVDMDGVLWLGDKPLPGLHAFFEWLTRRSVAYVLATNNASREPAFYTAKLARMGVVVTEDRILTSAMATADWLQRALPPRAKVFVLGEEGLHRALAGAGFQVVREAIARAPHENAHARRLADLPDTPGEPQTLSALPQAGDSLTAVDAVVVGIDFGLSYRALRDATLLIRRGARFVGTNGDLTYPSELGLVPGAGSILAALRAATGVEPIIVGKPEPHLFEAALRRLGLPAARTAMLGDRMDTDIVGAKRMGLATILITTGVDDATAARQAGLRPDLIVSGLDELVRLWHEQPARQPSRRGGRTARPRFR